MKKIKKKKIGQILLDVGAITEEQMKKALEDESGKPLSHILVDLGFIKESEIAQVLAKEIGFPYVDLSDYEINPHAATSIPEEIALRYLVLPIDFDENTLTVAMFDPSNVFAIDDIKILTGYDIEPVICTETDILNAITDVYKIDRQVDDVVESVDDQEVEIDGDSKGTEDDDSSPIVKMIDSLLVESVRQRANDIHIEPQDDGVRIRYRIDGVLQDVTYSPKKIQAGLISRIKILAGMDIAEKRVPQDGRFSSKVDKKDVDFRVASLPTVYGEKIVLRILEKESILMGIKDLGMEKDTLDSFRKSFRKPYGAILVTGPTGCGKTTTLYGALNILNSEEKNLITLEDPVEYRLAGINQVQVNRKAGMTFGAGLRSILRNDPDIVMIGEIRDKETAKISVESALTGHLVLSTLHTNNTAATLTRLIEMQVEPFLIASAVDCIVAQRLARRLCRTCREEYTPTKEILEKIGIKQGSKKLKLYRAKGCKRCSETGYRGRIGLYEVLRMNEQIEKLVVRKENAEVIEKLAKEQGLISLRNDGYRKALKGITSIAEVLRVTV